MGTAIADSQHPALVKISNGIRIYREESFAVPVQSAGALKRTLSFFGISRIILLPVIICLLAFGAANYVYSYYNNPKPTPSAVVLTAQNLAESKPIEPVLSTALSVQTGSGLPVRLKIPIINVDAALESVGLTPQGELEVPTGPANAAWFNLGPRPGENGSSVIDGHFGRWKNGTEAVFNNLDKLQKGDKLYVEDAAGATITFVVRETRIYDPGADSTGVFGSNDGTSHLNLITCDGVWNNSQKTYSNRLVVFTDKETE